MVLSGLSTYHGRSHFRLHGRPEGGGDGSSHWPTPLRELVTFGLEGEVGGGVYAEVVASALTRDYGAGSFDTRTWNGIVRHLLLLRGAGVMTPLAGCVRWGNGMSGG